MENAQVSFKRSNYFIDRDFQTKFIIRFCLLILAAGFLTVGLFYLLAKQSTTVAIINSRVVVLSTADFLMPMIVKLVAVGMVVFGIAVFFMTMLFSHKIAGPLYRFRKTIEAVKEGNLASNFHLRDYDQLKSLSEEVNAMISKMREQINLVKKGIGGLKEKKGNISEQEIAELEKEINYFKT
ncbi:MAG: methyl-accepting chemotaxis protein [Candidatus Omnitrophica bacterium]|jgi:methyl-accepting chemotaxis protein|nr:methyl-accepting chemotaxis protein [Candidatus Omnitrophota bacterium]MDD3275075.1 methyl-accepting chemotaxis protein [Candidatus Omnitrophota bacterium]MDD5078356.1 methyl-accepting chemotaxis protein [Candidatus Omnitrophota bacterium]MDD5725551.1 methyl-accepting chemotaxis protein [Candidatus Omnitrophota bacterium]